MPRGELERDPAAEAVADQVDAVEAERVHRLDHVGDMRLEIPRRLPAGMAVAAEVERDHPVRAEPLLRQPPEADRRGS